MTPTPKISLRAAYLTPTWRGDFEQFRLLRRSMERFGLAQAEHHVIVQTEDMALFRPLAIGGVRLHATADLLPADIEAGRVRCLRQGAADSRWRARLRRSLNKRVGWFDWVRYSGWQVQQISKLQAAVALDADVFVVLDSDMLFCAAVPLAEFVVGDKALLLENEVRLSRSSPGLDFRWAETAHRLIGKPFQEGQPINGRLGTPYVLDREVMRALHAALERRHARRWYQVLIEERLISWSEFALYNAFAEDYVGVRHVRHQSGKDMDGLVLHSEEHRRDAAMWIRRAFESPDIRFLRVQSKARDDARWSAADLVPLLDPYLKAP
jgi:hypothetical protein